MAFKMRSGNTPAFKKMGSSGTPMKFLNSLTEAASGAVGAVKARREEEMNSAAGMDPISTEGMSTPQRIDTIEGRVNELSSSKGRGKIGEIAGSIPQEEEKQYSSGFMGMHERFKDFREGGGEGSFGNWWKDNKSQDWARPSSWSSILPF